MRALAIGSICFAVALHLSLCEWTKRVNPRGVIVSLGQYEWGKANPDLPRENYATHAERVALFDSQQDRPMVMRYLREAGAGQSGLYPRQEVSYTVGVVGGVVIPIALIVTGVVILVPTLRTSRSSSADAESANDDCVASLQQLATQARTDSDEPRSSMWRPRQQREK